MWGVFFTVLFSLAVAQASLSKRQLVQPGPGNMDQYCPPGFQRLDQGRYCYRHFTRLSSWTEAYIFCKSINTMLVTVASPDENTLISNLVRNNGFQDQQVWMSGNNMLDQWSWASVFGSWHPMPYTNWAQGQPPISNISSGGGSFQCTLFNDGYWQSEDCSSSHAFVCKSEIDGLVGP